jgi:hypothetical protein
MSRVASAINLGYLARPPPAPGSRLGMCCGASMDWLGEMFTQAGVTYSLRLDREVTIVLE